MEDLNSMSMRDQSPSDDLIPNTPNSNSPSPNAPMRNPSTTDFATQIPTDQAPTTEGSIDEPFQGNTSSPGPSPDGGQVDNPFLSIKHLLWKFLLIFIVFFVIIIAFALIGIEIEVATSDYGQDISPVDGQNVSPFFEFAIPAVSQISIAIFSWVTLRQIGINMRQLIGTFPPRYHWSNGVGLAIALLIFSISSVSVLVYGILSLFPITTANVITQSVIESTGQHNSFWVAVGIAILAVVIAPPVEEFAFRGLFLHYWSSHRSIQKGLIFTAILFACLHPQNFVGMFAFSLVMALLYIRTRNLWVPIGVHGIYNAIVVLPPLLARIASDYLGLTIGEENTTTTAQAVAEETIATVSDPRFGLSAMVFLAIASFFIVRFLIRHWPKCLTALPYFQNHPDALS